MGSWAVAIGIVIAGILGFMAWDIVRYERRLREWLQGPDDRKDGD